jgi:thioredoxin 1
MLELTKDNFKKEVLESAVPVLVDFFATWCGPCKMMMPVVEELAANAGQNFKVAKINVDEANDLAQEYEVMSIPTFVIFKNGKETERVMGAQAKEKLLELLK